MKKYLTLAVSLLLLITCSIEVGSNLVPLLQQEADNILYIETGDGEATSTPQEDLLNFDYSIDDFPNAGS